MGAKKPTKSELRARLRAIRERHAGPDATYEAAVARAAAFLEDLQAGGFGRLASRSQPLTTFLETWKAPVVLAGQPLSEADIRSLEEAVGARLPGSYAEFLRTWGSVRFYRSNEAKERAFVFNAEEAIASFVRLEQLYASAFTDYRSRYPALAATYGEAPESWAKVPLKTEGLFSVRDAEAFNMLPICPYYEGGFCLALHAMDTRGEAPIFCVSPDGDPLTFTLYGQTMLEWVGQMVTWSILEIDQWIGISL